MKAIQTRHLRPEDLRGLRFRGYLRESTQAQADRGTPLARQRDDIQRAADELGMVAAPPTWYERVGSGEATGAPELAEALAHRGEYDVLVCFAQSRFARNRTEAVVQKRAFRDAGLIIYFVAERLISGTYTGALAEGVSEVLDERANEERRMYVAGGLRQRQVSGRWVGTIPVGYRRVLVDFPDGTRGWDGGLEPDPTFAPIVRRIYDESAAGSGARRIAHALNDDGIRTPLGRPWGERSAYGVLTSRAYTGRIIRYPRLANTAYYGYDSPDGRADLGIHFPAIIDETLWAQVQEGIEHRRSARGTGGVWVYPLSGVLRCAACRYRMTGMNNRVTRYYRCAGRARFRSCRAPAIRADVAEDQFASWIGSYHLPDDWRTAVAHTSLDRMKVDDRERQTNGQERVKRLQKMYAWGDIDEAEYRRETASIRSAITIVRPGLAGLEAVAEVLRDLGPAWRSASPEAQAAVPPLILKEATVSKGRVDEWVVRAELRPLLDLCVPDAAYPGTRDRKYTVRFSA